MDVNQLLVPMMTALASMSTSNIEQAKGMMEFYMDRSRQLGVDMKMPAALEGNEAPSQVEVLQGALGMMEALESFRQRLAPPTAQASLQPGQDPSVMIQLKGMELNHALKMEELQDQRDASRQEFELRMEEIRAKNSRNDNVGAALGSLANNVNEMMVGNSHPDAGAAPDENGEPVGTPQQQFSTITCPNEECGHSQQVRVGQRTYTCEGCGEVHQVNWQFKQGG